MDFYKRAALVCQQIPRGKAASYGQIALLCGKPKNARQVGYALSHGLAGEDVPAHRVVNAKGILSGAAAFATADLQKQMLQHEGVEVFWTEDGWRVDLKKDGWKNTMEDALYLREEFSKKGI
ncbi:MGMT family protein [Faecalicatena sp. AGMB00832]|uniref:MGMT family protein n=1 Tax=Faecalicatena faecalis TaxID=2726362 RepID=A0ABS6D9C6_9FIRM|nr:MGMT family protein [Faecalicatena faecalis]MBU3878223.1 MGMT family protein [Faecalicatena faecalis]